LLEEGIMAHVAGHFDTSSPLAPAPQVRRVPTAQCLVWLQRGWADLRRLPVLSLGCGALVALAGVLLLVVSRQVTYLTPALIGGFALVAPFVASVFYALSRQLERGETPDLTYALGAVWRNPGATALFGLVLTLGMMVWARTCALTFALFYNGVVPDLTQPFTDLLFSGHYTGLLLGFLAIGTLIASVVFSFGVITAPMLIDRERTDVFSAMLTSLRCCAANPAAAALWAAVIAGLTLLGFATLMLGLVVIFPLLGHASWHAYRELVAESDA
jgi:uncharacterized membrane protein